jgi:hypothetical protein
VVSVGHRSNLRTFHDYVLDVAAFNPRPEQLLARSKSDLDVVTLATRPECLPRPRTAIAGTALGARLAKRAPLEPIASLLTGKREAGEA